jgi:DNA mismatch repair protein MutL
MAKIEVLQDNVANQIAAGEVIARPASCVKELLENSIDSGARNITITIEGAGKKLIEIRDDGCGMDKEDLETAFLRHATSKIRSIADLNYIETLGFRGEALASIASVARIEAYTNDGTGTSGSYIIIEGGKIKDEGPKASNKGTVISVKDLFYNTPARLKFLKSDYTEEAHIIDTVIYEGFSRENLSIRLIIDGREAVFFPAGSLLKDRIRMIDGREVSDALLEISWFSDNVKVYGYAAKPSVTKNNRNSQYLFVNNRNIQSRSLSYAVHEGYGTLLMKGKYPYSYVFIDINPSMVDVNVHPTKAEVKFKEERTVFNGIKKAVEDSLKNNNLTPEVSAGMGASYAPIYQTGTDIIHGAQDSMQQFFANESSMLFDRPNIEVKKSKINTPDAPQERSYMDMKALGQVHKTYIVGEDDGNLVIIDQHAAHEKTLYEKIVDDIEKGCMKVQEMLIPEVIEVTPSDKKIIEANKEAFNKLGFFLDEFGETEYKISAHPVIIRQKAAAPFVNEMIGLLREKDKADEKEVFKRLTSTMACRAAVKAGDELKDAEIEELLNNYFRLKDPHSCPHGRPPIIKVPFEEIEKMFKRRL